jgi:hypothetical protein
VAGPLPAHGTCIGGGAIIEQICYSDTGLPQAANQWYFTGTSAFTGSTDITELTTLVQQEYSAIVGGSSVTFVNGENGFTSAALTKLTNLQAYDYISELCFLTGPFDFSVEPSLGTAFGGDMLTPQGPRSTCPVCQSTLTSGSTANYMQACVLQNGNIVAFRSPAAVEDLQAGVAEGYAICDTSVGGSEYYDFGGFGDSTAWSNSVITQPGGANTLPLTVTRGTADGLWTLTQTFSRNTGTPSITVAMKLTNNSISSRSPILLRYSDIDAHSTTTNRFDYTQNSAWGYVAPICVGLTCAGDFGLALATVPTTVIHEAYVQDVPTAPNACSTGTNVAQTPFSGDGSVFLQFSFQNIPKNGSKTVSIIYRPL